MSGPLDLRTVLFLNVDETAALFRQDRAWVYRHRDGLLRTAARRFGPKTLLFLQSEILRIIAAAADPPPLKGNRVPYSKTPRPTKTLSRKDVKEV